MRNILGTKSLLTDISHITENCPEISAIDFVYLKNTEEVAKLKESASLVRDLLLQLHKIIKPGICELDIVTFCENYMLIRGADPVLKTKNIFPSPISISKNNVAFHGIPENSILVDGDIITVDIVLLKDGWYGDGAWTYIVGESCESTQKLVQFSSDIIFQAVKRLEITKDLASIGEVINEECEKSGYRVINEGAGHGIGQSLHEDPQILYSNNTESFEIIPGMVFTIEPVIADNNKKLQYCNDGAAFLEAGSLTAQFEHMIAVNNTGLEILTSRNPFFK